MIRIESLTPPRPLSPPDPRDIASRLDGFRALRNGWLEGRGVAPTAAGLDWLTAAFANHFPDASRSPRLYPTAEGGVQAEWMLGAQDVSLTIDLSTQSAYWHVLDLATDEDADDHFDLSTAGEWARLVRKLDELGGTKA